LPASLIPFGLEPFREDGGRVGYIEELKRVGRDANPFFTLMGIELGEYGDGRASLTMEVRPDMLNGAGWLQGGIYVALADEAIALALCTLLADDEKIATIDEHTSFIKGVNAGTIAATGRVIRKGRRVAFADGEVRDAADGALLSRTSTSFAVIGR
jgi:acyl-CoA thioesterase